MVASVSLGIGWICWVTRELSDLTHAGASWLFAVPALLMVWGGFAVLYERWHGVLYVGCGLAFYSMTLGYFFATTGFMPVAHPAVPEIVSKGVMLTSQTGLFLLVMAYYSRPIARFRFGELTNQGLERAIGTPAFEALIHRLRFEAEQDPP
jgi:hypothetical protein